MSDHLENMRRMAERGLKCAQSPPMESTYVDIFQYILDEHNRAKSDFEALANKYLDNTPPIKEE